MIILGIDPGFANFGWAVVQFEKAQPPRLLASGVIRTDARAGRLTVSESNAQRCGQIADALVDIMDNWRPWIIGTEAQSWTRRHKADVQVAQAFGIIFALAGVDGCPVVHLPPQVVKQKICGVKSATKQQIQDALADRLVDYGPTIGQIPKTTRHHAADAAAVALAAQTSDLALALVRRGAGA